MATIDWSKSVWAGEDSVGAARSSFSIQDADATSQSVVLQNLSNLLDENSAVIQDSVASKTYSLGLGIDTAVATGAGDHSEGLAHVGKKSGDFAVAEVEVVAGSSGGVGNLKTLTLLSKAQVVNGTPAATDATIILASNTLTKVVGADSLNGAPVADTLYVTNFGSAGTIDLMAGADVLEFASDGAFTNKTIVVDGGLGNDTVKTHENAVTIKLGYGTKGTAADSDGQDSVEGWAESKGTIQLAEGQAFSNISLIGWDLSAASLAFTMSSYADSIGGVAGARTTFKTSVATIASAAADGAENRDNYFATKISDGTLTKNTIVFTNKASVYGTASQDTEADVTVSSALAGSTQLYITQGNQEATTGLDFTGSGKKYFFLGHSDGSGAEFNDTAQYVQVSKIQMDTVGSSWALGGSKAATLSAGGEGDSLCGLFDVADTLVSANNKRTYFGTLNNAGEDVVSNFTFGNTQNVASDVAVFVDGVDFTKTDISGDYLNVGSSSDDHLAIDISANNANAISDNGGLYLNYQTGLGAESIATALIDVAGGTSLQFNKDLATTYVGGITGSGETTLALGTDTVKLNFDSVYESYGIKSINGSTTAAGSMINGTTDAAQNIVASAVGNSFVCGGFSGNFIDLNADTLTGSGSSDYTTEFFVGKTMGSDVVTNLSDKDKVTFLNTKLSDLSSYDTAGDKLVAYFNNSDKVVLNVEGGDASKLTDVTLQFDGVAVKWNGTGFVSA